MSFSSLVIVGNFGSTNIGDEALLESLLLLVRDIPGGSTAPIHVLSSDPADTLARYNAYNITSSPLFPCGFRTILTATIPFIQNFSKLLTSSHVLFGGGGLYTDKHSIYPMILWGTQHFFLCTILRKKVMIIGQSFHTPRTALGKFILKYILKSSEQILVRDEGSKESIASLTTKSIEVLPDLAFLLPRVTSQKKEGINIALSLRPDQFTTPFFLRSICESLKNIGATHVDLVPMQYIKEEDMSILKSFGEQYLTPANIVWTLTKPKNYQDVMQIISQNSFSLGMRLHFCIFSVLANTPVLPLSYSAKVSGVFEKMNIPTVSMENINTTNLTASLQNLKLPSTIDNKRNQYLMVISDFLTK